MSPKSTPSKYILLSWLDNREEEWESSTELNLTESEFKLLSRNGLELSDRNLRRWLGNELGASAVKMTRLTPQTVVTLWKRLPVIVYPNKHNLVVAFWLDTRRVSVKTVETIAAQISRILQAYSSDNATAPKNSSKISITTTQKKFTPIESQTSPNATRKSVKKNQKIPRPSSSVKSTSNVAAIKIPEMSFDEAMNIVMDFNDFMDQRDYGTFYRAADLPYPKNKIKTAVRKILFVTNEKILATGVVNCGLQLSYYQDDVTEPVSFRMMNIEAIQKINASGVKGEALQRALEPFLGDDLDNQFYLALQERASVENDEIFRGINLSRFD